MRFKPLKEVNNAVLLAMAPDCGRICIWLTKKPIGNLTLRAGGERRALDHHPPASGTLAVVELGAWKVIFSTPLVSEPMDFSFFRGSDALYGVTEPHSLGRRLSDRMAMVIDLRTGKVQRLATPATAGNTAYYSALGDPTLIGIRGGQELVRAEWPSLRELATIRTDGHVSGLTLAADRERFIHRVGQLLVCRRTEDLGILWTRHIDASVDMSATLSGHGVPGPSMSIAYTCFSADGSTAALGARRVNNIAAPVEFYIEILNGNEGTPVARWRRNPDQGIALSPDGQLLAIAELVETKNDLRPTIRVYEVPSGKEVATIVHDRVGLNRRLGGAVGAGQFGFTPDGKYLITANDYKLRTWEIQRE